MRFLSTLLLFAAVASASAESDQCQQRYQSYLCLSTYALARTWCRRSHPCDRTSTVKTTTTKTRTVCTVTSTTGTSTVTTTVDTSTITSTTKTVTETTTTYSTSTSVTACASNPGGKKRAALEERGQRPDPAALLAKLKKQPGSYGASACKCLKCCSTTTVTSTCTAWTTTTATVQTAATITTSVTATATISTDTTTTISTDYTSTKTVRSCSAPEASPCADGTVPKVCNSDTYCSNTGCYCGSDTDGNSRCLPPDNYANRECGTCVLNSDCPPGEVCITDSCCGSKGNLCVSSDTGSCENTNSPRKLFLRGRRALKRDGKPVSPVPGILPPLPVADGTKKKE